MKVTPEVLRAIALELKSQETTQYEFTYVFYYLPGNGPDEVPGHRTPWASTEFNPTLVVRIMGLSIDEEQSLIGKPLVLPNGSRLLGAWLMDEPKHRIAIYQNDGKWYLQGLFSWSKQVDVDELQELPMKNGQCFTKKTGSERYVIDSEEKLGLYDRDGLIVEPARVKLTPTFSGE
jgi:hypothetical protein